MLCSKDLVDDFCCPQALFILELRSDILKVLKVLSLVSFGAFLSRKDHTDDPSAVSGRSKRPE
jgi:hypothetical protein